ncbi:hypothetical protein D3C80_368910 [compost metagenome]
MSRAADKSTERNNCLPACSSIGSKSSITASTVSRGIQALSAEVHTQKCRRKMPFNLPGICLACATTSAKYSSVRMVPNNGFAFFQQDGSSSGSSSLSSAQIYANVVSSMTSPTYVKSSSGVFVPATTRTACSCSSQQKEFRSLPLFVIMNSSGCSRNLKPRSSISPTLRSGCSCSSSSKAK